MSVVVVVGFSESSCATQLKKTGDVCVDHHYIGYCHIVSLLSPVYTDRGRDRCICSTI